MRVYRIQNKVNGKIYIGKTTKPIEQRLELHFKNARNGRRSRLYSSIRKHGESSFSIEQLEICNDLKHLNEREKYYIAFYCSQDKDIGYNMTEGGDGGENESSKLATSFFRKGKTFDEIYGEENSKIYREKISTGVSNFWHGKYRAQSQVSIDKISKSLSDKWVTDLEFREEALKRVRRSAKSRIGKKGVVHSDETKRRLSECRKGKTYEECMGLEVAKKLKEQRRRAFLENNPNRIKVSAKNFLDIIDILLDNPYKRMEEIECGLSLYIKRKMMQEIFGLTNIQKFRQNNSKEKIIEILKNKRQHYENME